jgi:hypothetical protein
MMRRHRARRAQKRTLGGSLRNNAGLTLLELMIAGIIGAIIVLAAFTMYLTSLDTWDLSGARLALQRNGDRAVKRIAFDIRHGDAVVVNAASDSLAVTRTIGGTTSLLATYALEGDQVVNMHGVALTSDVTELTFSTSNGIKVWISMTLEDDMGTSSNVYDDQRVEISSVAVCRNEPT